MLIRLITIDNYVLTNKGKVRLENIIHENYPILNGTFPQLIKVKDESGFRIFDGKTYKRIKYIYGPVTKLGYIFQFQGKRIIKCNRDHLFIYKDECIAAFNMSKNDLVSFYDSKKRVNECHLKTSEITNNYNYYDLFIEDTSPYICNDIFCKSMDYAEFNNYYSKYMSKNE